MRASHFEQGTGMDEGCMNAARREIVAELRNQGLTGKEAYEASKDPQFMDQWIRVSIKDSRVDGKTKRAKTNTVSWRHRLRELKKIKAIQLKKEIGKRKKTVARANRIRRMFEGGLTIVQALRIDRKASND